MMRIITLAVIEIVDNRFKKCARANFRHQIVFVPGVIEGSNFIIGNFDTAP